MRFWIRCGLFLCMLFIGVIQAGASDTPPQILTSTFPVYQLVRNVVGEDLQDRVMLFLPAQTGCPHDYALTPQDMRKLSQADVFVINGLGLEPFAETEMFQANPDVKLLDASKGIEDLLREGETNAHHIQASHHHEHEDHTEEESSHHYDHGVLNPHIFASPRMAAHMAVFIAEQLGQLDPQRKELYLTRARTYAERLNALADDMAERAGRLRNRSILTQHGIFDYLGRDLGLTIVAVMQEHPGQEPSAARLLQLVKLARERHAGAVFAEPQYPQRTGAEIAREANIPFAVLDPAASGPDNAPLSYFEDVMRTNMQTLEQTLGVR